MKKMSITDEIDYELNLIQAMLIAMCVVFLIGLVCFIISSIN